MKLEFHPASQICPDMDESAFQSHKADIAANGQKETIKLLDGQILDGRHRYRACIELGMEPKVENVQTDDPFKYVISLNVERRHLIESQRGMVAARLANLQHGANRYSNNAGNDDKVDAPIGASTLSIDSSQSEAAAKLRVGRTTVQRANRVIKNQVPEVISAVDKGEIKLGTAEKIIKLPKEQQPEAVEKAKKINKKTRASSDGKTKPKSRSRKTKGTHLATEEEVTDSSTELQAMLQKWESLGGLKKLVSDWKDDKRWNFCDNLESLSRILRRHATELRHYSPSPPS